MANFLVKTLFLLYLTQLGLFYNIDFEIPIVKRGVTNSFFGFSLAQHRKGIDTNGNNEPDDSEPV